MDVKKIREAVPFLAAEGCANAKFAEHLQALFDALVPEKIGKDYEDALLAQDYGKAVALCAAYYRGRPDCPVEELSGKGSYQVAAADKAIAGFMREVNIDWHFPDGDIDFLFNPTELQGPVNHEWLWQLGRHSYWKNMAATYRATGEEKYAAGFEKQLLKWIAQTYIPENWNGPGSTWRTIECGIRLDGSWPIAFEVFRKSKTLSDVALLLMIASMHRQSLHLVAHPTGHNWLMMEANGVYTFSSLFPEFRDSEANRKTAAKWLLEELRLQILPDGMHNELSPDYHRVVFNCAADIYNLAMACGQKEELSGDLVTLLEKAADATVAMATPGFTQPRTNDCFTLYTGQVAARAEKLIASKPEYAFARSGRREGQPPAGETPSRFLPYAGFAVMRSDWGPEATYLCFDVGPLGKAHIHQDKLNINLYKGKEELIYDDGGGQYELSALRKYAISAHAHNTVLVDGLGQNREGPKQVEEAIDAGWISNEGFDYAVGVYDDGFGPERVKPAVHKREVRFCKPGFFCVTDHLTAVDGKPHSYEVLFQLDTDFGREYEVALIPLDGPGCVPELKVVSAQTEPVLRGWYNGRNESNLHASTTVSREVTGVRDYRFTTLLVPLRRGQALPCVQKTEGQTWKIDFDGISYGLDPESLDAGGNLE